MRQGKRGRGSRGNYESRGSRRNHKSYESRKNHGRASSEYNSTQTDQTISKLLQFQPKKNEKHNECDGNNDNNEKPPGWYLYNKIIYRYNSK